MSSLKSVEPSVLKNGISFVRSNLALIILIVIGLVSIPLYAIGRQPWELGSHTITVYWLYTPALVLYLIAGMSVTAMKVSMLFFEGITTLFLILIFRQLNQPPVRVLFYLGNPLIIWELASSGHIDSAMIAMVAVAIWAYLTDRAIITG